VQPFIFQRVVSRGRGFVSGNNYEPNASSQVVLVSANNFSQTTPNPIANDRAAEAS
jgi:hypothetical protein